MNLRACFQAPTFQELGQDCSTITELYSISKHKQFAVLLIALCCYVAMNEECAGVMAWQIIVANIH